MRKLFGVALTTAALLFSSAAAGAAPGDVFTWGDNTFGQLGDGTTTPRLDPASPPVGSTVDIAGGRHHVVALRADGSVVTWGWNGVGQIGDGTTTNRTSPFEVPLNGVSAVGAGHYHSMAVVNGSVWTWGRNSDGQLGLGDQLRRTVPTQVANLTDVVGVAGGPEHSIALRADGTIRTWGNNDFGQLGNGTTTSSNFPLDVSAFGGVTAITAGRSHTAVLRNDGTVWTWGDNTYGQLGIGTTSAASTPQLVDGLSGIVDVEAFGFHTIAIDDQGRVWAWGRNNLGQLGDSTKTQRLTPVRVGVPNSVAIGSGRDYGMAATADGTIWTWGRNDLGQLGDTPVGSRTTPVAVEVIADTVELVGGRDYITVRSGEGEEDTLQCTATVVGDDLALEWTDGFGRAVIRRDAGWHSTPGNVTNTTIEGAAADDAQYLVRLRIDGVVTDVPCDRIGEPPPPAGPCTATVNGDDMVLSWDPEFARVNVRQDGGWLLTAPAGATTITIDGGGDSIFEIVVRPGGVRTTYSCE